MPCLPVIENYKKYSPYLRKVTQRQYNGQITEEYVYTYFLFDTIYGGKPQNIMAFNFRLDWMGSAMSYMTEGDTGREVFVIDENRRVVYANAKEFI